MKVYVPVVDTNEIVEIEMDEAIVIHRPIEFVAKYKGETYIVNDIYDSEEGARAHLNHDFKTMRKHWLDILDFGYYPSGYDYYMDEIWSNRY